MPLARQHRNLTANGSSSSAVDYCRVRDPVRETEKVVSLASFRSHTWLVVAIVLVMLVVLVVGVVAVVAVVLLLVAVVLVVVCQHAWNPKVPQMVPNAHRCTSVMLQLDKRHTRLRRYSRRHENTAYGSMKSSGTAGHRSTTLGSQSTI